MTHRNPATILHNVLEQGRQEKSDQPCNTVWNKLLHVEAEGGLISKLSGIMDLPRQIISLVNINFPNRNKTILGWAPYVENAFMNQNLSGTWQTFIGHIPEHSLHSLELTAELLNTKFATSEISTEDMKRLLDMLHELVIEVDTANLPPDIKVYLARELNELQHRLRSYAITGALPILRQVESMAGHCLVDKNYYKFLTDHDLGKRLLDSLNAMAATVTVAVGLPQLSQTLGQLLLR